MKTLRGALIVVEGCDRSGKTTQCKKIVSLLNAKDIPAEYMNFPDRKTPIGKLINDYLTKKEDFPDRAIHLLFSANRWELAHRIEKLLLQGTTVIIDRYAYSGVAFSAAKPTLELEWCKQPDSGLPKPDLVLLLSLTPEAQRARVGFGEERYEKDEIQRKVTEIYKTLQDLTWKMVILPSTFVNSPRYLHEYTQDAFAYVRNYGRPDLFITLTCNPSWNEITDELMPGFIREIDADKTEGVLTEELLCYIRESVERSKSLPLEKLW